VLVSLLSQDASVPPGGKVFTEVEFVEEMVVRVFHIALPCFLQTRCCCREAGPSKGHRQQQPGSPKKAGTISNRRLLADQDYARLKDSGPPKDARYPPPPPLQPAHPVYHTSLLRRSIAFYISLCILYQLIKQRMSMQQ
jgi:hypothetical protein